MAPTSTSVPALTARRIWARTVVLAPEEARWGVDRSAVTAENGMLGSGDHSGTFGEFAAAAAGIQLEAEPAIKTPDQFTLLGTSVARLDTPVKVNGSAVYGIDAQVPDMVFAAVEVSPVFLGASSVGSKRIESSPSGVGLPVARANP